MSVVYVGLYDLKTVGYPGDVQHPEVTRVVHQIVKMVSAHGVPAELCNDESMLIKAHEDGVVICYRRAGILRLRRVKESARYVQEQQ